MWPSSHSQWGNATRLGSESIGRATVAIVTPSEVRAETSTVRALVLIITNAESAASMVSMSTLSAPPRAVKIRGRVVSLTSHTGISEVVAATSLLVRPKPAKGSPVLACTCGSSSGLVSRSGAAATESFAAASIVASCDVHAEISMLNTTKPVVRFTLNHPSIKAPVPASRIRTRIRGPRERPEWHPVASRLRLPGSGRPKLRAPSQSRTLTGLPSLTPRQ